MLQYMETCSHRETLSIAGLLVILGEPTPQRDCFGLWARARHSKQRRLGCCKNIFYFSRKDHRFEFDLRGFLLWKYGTSSLQIKMSYSAQICFLFPECTVAGCTLFVERVRYMTHYGQNKHVWHSLTEAHPSRYSKCSFSAKTNE